MFKNGENYIHIYIWFLCMSFANMSFYFLRQADCMRSVWSPDST